MENTGPLKTTNIDCIEARDCDADPDPQHSATASDFFTISASTGTTWSPRIVIHKNAIRWWLMFPPSVPGFELFYLLVSIFLGIAIHQRSKIHLYIECFDEELSIKQMHSREHKNWIKSAVKYGKWMQMGKRLGFGTWIAHFVQLRHPLACHGQRGQSRLGPFNKKTSEGWVVPHHMGLSENSVPHFPNGFADHYPY